jgi:hypothetical protein
VTLYRRVVHTVDSHTEGNATRFIVGGVPEPPGAGHLEKRSWLMRHDDALRRMVNFEPRGSSMMCSVLKLNRLGGFSPAQQTIAICEAAAIGVSVDTNPYTIVGDTACCHIAATTRFPYPVDCEGHVSFLHLGEPSPFRGGITFTGGRARLPDAPGLGVDADWAELERRQRQRGTGAAQ